jgi:ferredoxin--NADP+ reductase
MMRAVADLTRPFKVPTMVSLNPIMVDGTGMCGGCRVTIGRQIKFACVDGPEFDAHQVDFEELVRRQQMYRGEEKESLERYVKSLEKVRPKRNRVNGGDGLAMRKR